MLVEFRVKNFKSIRDDQVFSMIASNDKSFEDTHIIKPDGASARLLKSAAVYGPNAGGKSNLLQAIGFMSWRLNFRRIPDSPFVDEYEKCPFFKLDTMSLNSPSEFEITFIDKGVRYQYGFSILGERVVEEWLWVYKSDKPQEWFHRKIDERTDEDNYKFSPYFKGQKSTWQKSTKKDALFLAIATELNSKLLLPVFRWLVKLEVLDRYLSPKRVMNIYSPELKNKRYKEILLDFLTAADICITDIEVITENKEFILTGKNEIGVETRRLTELESKKPIFIHSHDGINKRFDFEEESEGTQRIFLLAFYILEALERGKILIIDELESSLHPALANFIIRLFNSADNKNGAQLIFSTHNTGLLNIKEIFRRDQIWFVEKDASQSTVLYSLADFNPRKDTAIESGYLTGRYGAIPFVTEFIPNLSEDDDGAR